MTRAALTVEIMSISAVDPMPPPPFVLRSAKVHPGNEGLVEAATDALDDLLIDGVYDGTDWRPQLLRRLRDASADGRVRYVVPGHPHLGDATVDWLQTSAGDDVKVELSLEPQLVTPPVGSGAVAYVDALLLSELVRTQPYLGGSLPLHSNVTTIVTNYVPGRDAYILQRALFRRFGADSEVSLYNPLDSTSRRAISLMDVSSFTGTGTWWIEIPRVKDDEFRRTSDDLQRLVARLRAPDGCPWDREQTNKSLTKNLVEESYELLDAIDRDDPKSIREELGDFILQGYMHAQIAEDDGAFTLEDVFAALIEKLVRRHPHVFATASAEDADAVVQTWDSIKRAERRENGEDDRLQPLGNVPVSLPALLRAQSVLKRAKRSGLASDEVQAHCDAALTETVEDAGVRASLQTLLDVSAHAVSDGHDLEEILRNWSKAFEASIAREAKRPDANARHNRA